MSGLSSLAGRGGYPPKQLRVGTSPLPLLKRKSPSGGFDSAGKSAELFITSTEGIVAIPAEMKSISSWRGEKRQRVALERFPPSHMCCHPGRLSLVLVEIILPSSEMCRLRGQHWPSHCLLSAEMMSIRLSAHTGIPWAQAGAASRHLPSHLSSQRGAHGVHRAPLFPLTKGRLWLPRCPSPCGPQQGRASGC